ncbi:MAG: pilus assembly protein PilM, partial [Verrucomicrobiota bacterium]|nr:pilus assembly protein PilM [Verrucomicrobiota bacterium]
MAKPPASVMGVDLGRYALKSVLLHRKGDRVAVTHYASRPIASPLETADDLTRELKELFKEMGSTAKSCAVAISSPDALIRIIEQPDTPTHMLREALRLNSVTLLNHDCRDFVLDCDRIAPSDDAVANAPSGLRRFHYLVGGVPRTEVNQVAQVFQRAGMRATTLQLAPICVFNAFEFAFPEIFKTQAFFIVDIGHTSSTMMVGAKGELVLVRSIDFGGRLLLETLMARSGEPLASVLTALEQEDEMMLENMRMAVSVLVREVGSSIGFFEGRREETITRIHVSGAPAKAPALLKVLKEELHMPCEP